jgi:hypothetical protein
MVPEGFITSIRAQPKSAHTAVAKDVGIYVHELQPAPAIKSSFKKSSTSTNALAVNSTHIFAAQAEKAVVHVYSRARCNQEALISFPERVQSLTMAGDGILVLGTAEGRVILWEVSPRFDSITGNLFTDSPRSVLGDRSPHVLPIFRRFLVSPQLHRILYLDLTTLTFMFGHCHNFFPYLRTKLPILFARYPTIARL